MNKLSKSPLSVARHAFALAKEHLPPYAHRYSPKTYTQPQLFVCLVLKTFFRTDYRGLVGILNDFDALQAYLNLKRVPHYTTLQKASRRLLKAPYAKRLFHGTVRRFLHKGGWGHSEYFLSPIGDAGSGLAQTWLGRICLPERPTVARITRWNEWGQFTEVFDANWFRE